jgi:hypothetical protein
MSKKSRRKQSSARAKKIARQQIAKSGAGAIPTASYSPAPAVPTRATTVSTAATVSTAPTMPPPTSTRTIRTTGPAGKTVMIPTFAYMGRDLKQIGIMAAVMIAVIAILSRFI